MYNFGLQKTGNDKFSKFKLKFCIITCKWQIRTSENHNRQFLMSIKVVRYNENLCDRRSKRRQERDNYNLEIMNTKRRKTLKVTFGRIFSGSTRGISISIFEKIDQPRITHSHNTSNAFIFKWMKFCWKKCSEMAKNSQLVLNWNFLFSIKFRFQITILAIKITCYLQNFSNRDLFFTVFIRDFNCCSLNKW